MSSYMAQGMKRDCVLRISGMTRHQYYYNKKGGKRGRKCSTHTLQHQADGCVLVSNDQVVDRIKEVQSDPDQV